MRRRLLLGAGAGVVVLLVGLLILQTGAFPAGLAIAILGGVAAILCIVFAIVLPLFGAGSRTEGIPGLARVVGVRPTGAQINGHWVYDADLIVDQTRVPAYRTTARIRVHRKDGTLRGGEILSVVRLREDAPDVSVLAGPARTPQDALVPEDAPPWA